jgi:uncharacterized DUF497 family protein
MLGGFRFNWDAAKNEANRRKHGISFEEAESVFFDEGALLINDPDHSESEERFILLGMAASMKILVVCHTYRKDDTEIRIISARKATKAEGRLYGG